MKSIIVTAADEKFSPHLRRLLASLRQWDAPLFDAIGVLDVGLSEVTVQQISGQAEHIVSPGWDLCCTADLRTTKPYLRAKTARPFLPQYFPGYDLYLWLDADIWVQEKFALEWFLQAAENGALGIVPQADPSYVHTAESINWRTARLAKYFGDESLTFIDSQPYYNGGAFSLLARAPHWDSWARHFKTGLAACSWMVSDQTALNYAIWKDQLPVHPLPALCNWCCHLAAPIKRAQTGKFCEPDIPHRPLGMIHMTGDTKSAKLRGVSQVFPAAGVRPKR